MSYKRRSDYKPPRDRSELRMAVLSVLAIVIATGSLVWFLRPNRESTTPLPLPSIPTVVTTVPTTTTPTTTTPPTPASTTP